MSWITWLAYLILDTWCVRYFHFRIAIVIFKWFFRKLQKETFCKSNKLCFSKITIVLIYNWFIYSHKCSLGSGYLNKASGLGIRTKQGSQYLNKMKSDLLSKQLLSKSFDLKGLGIQKVVSFFEQGSQRSKSCQE